MFAVWAARLTFRFVVVVMAARSMAMFPTLWAAMSIDKVPADQAATFTLSWEIVWAEMLTLIERGAMERSTLGGIQVRSVSEL